MYSDLTLPVPGTLERRAFALAHVAHKDQRYDGLPYLWHLCHTISLAKQACLATRVLLPDPVSGALWLHDAIEDGVATYEAIANGVHPRTADLVQAVSDEPGANRRERKAATLPKTRAAGEWAVFIKLADRLANVQQGHRMKSQLLSMYVREHDSFSDALRQRADNAAVKLLWASLDILIADADRR